MQLDSVMKCLSVLTKETIMYKNKSDQRLIFFFHIEG